MHGLTGLEFESVPAVVTHCQHPVCVPARPDHAHHAGNAVQRGSRDGVDRLLNAGLHLRIKSRLDQIAVAGDVFLTDTRLRQVFQCVITEEGAIPRRDAALWKRIRLRQNAQRLFSRGAKLVGVFGQILDHGVEHQVATIQGALRIGVGVQRAGGLHQTGQ